MASKAAIAARGLPIRGLLDQGDAAIYLAMSPSMFREGVVAGSLPRPRIYARKRLWDIDDLDSWRKSLPKDGEGAEQDSWSDL